MQIKELINKIWFPVFLIVIIIIFFFYDRNTAIIIAVIGIIILLIQIIYEWMQNQGFPKRIAKYLRIDDKTISDEFNLDIAEVQSKMIEIMKNESKKVLIIHLKNSYISYNNKMEDVLYKILILKNATAEDAIRVLSKHGIEKKAEIDLLRKILKERHPQ